MIKQKWFTFLACAILFFVETTFACYTTPWLQLALLVALLMWLSVFIGSILFAIQSWRKLRLLGFIPLAVCLVTIPAATVSGEVAQAIQFRSQLPKFDAVITQIKERDIPSGSGRVRIHSDVANFVVAERTSHGNLQVEFVTDGGLPVKHVGYLYTETGLLEPGSVMAKWWPYTRQVRPKWLRVSD